MEQHFAFDSCSGCNCASQFNLHFLNKNGRTSGAHKASGLLAPSATSGSASAGAATMEVPLAFGSKQAHPTTVAVNKSVLTQLPFDDTTDFDEAKRGYVMGLADGKVVTANGIVVWDMNHYAFLSAKEAPPTINPSLYRCAQLNMNAGLFQVCERVYQIRGLDISNMTIVEGESGLIITDVLSTTEAAQAALALYYQHRPHRPVNTVIYSHSHSDHFGGALGVVSAEDAASGAVNVVAPAGFMEAVSGENVLVGSAMARRAQFQFGILLARSPQGQVDTGLGKAIAWGTPSLVAPNKYIVDDVEAHVFDGVEIIFHLAPETEAPVEVHQFYPEFGVLNLAENACRHMHNFCPLRGAVVRDPRVWSKKLNEALDLFGDRTTVLIGQHHWPTWGRAEVRTFVAKQRDLYKYVHDQTVRLMNIGMKPTELAEVIKLPPSLSQEFSLRDYYGTVKHNAKAVYQRYLGWYDAHPANLNPLPPKETGLKMLEYMGGADAVLRKAQRDYEAGEFRWVAQVMCSIAMAEPQNLAVRALAADALEQLGYQAESATWRNAYLYGAQELRTGVRMLPPRPMLSPSLLGAITTDKLLDFIAIRLDPVRVASSQSQSWSIAWTITDTKETVRQSLSNSTLFHTMGDAPRGIGLVSAADATVSISRSTLVELALGTTTVGKAVAAGLAQVGGEKSWLPEELFSMLTVFQMQFDVMGVGVAGPQVVAKL